VSGYILDVIFFLVISLMTVQAIFNVRLRLFIWEQPEHAWLNHAPARYLPAQLSFTILLPARHEEAVYRATIQKVYNLNYPKELMQIIAICREDDPGTIAEAKAKIDELKDANVQLLIFNDRPINKPHGLNLGLQVARGDIVTIFDALTRPCLMRMQMWCRVACN
jgi:cellulose synthase/poly-beta-1,6-N-acetylglucosamine synthase-like glycosyltransferase